MATSRDPPTAVDESLKRNTDCIYFLASPLTCKKGSECEYRHSEYARVNPRDCWFWLNGNCLNPKCSFRHPPLDGLLGGQVGGQSGPPAAPSQAAPSAPQASARQPIPCIFFQKGYCLKGDRCSFLHGPNPPNVKMQQLATAVPVSEAPPPKKGSSGREKHPHLNTNLPANVSKVFGVPAEVNASKVKNPPASNAVTTEKRGPPSTTLIAEHTKSKETMAPPVNNGILRRGRAYQASSLDDRTIHNVRDADEPLRESSPGFDVLVDDKLRDTDYYHNDERYARMRGHDGRDLNEFEIGHHVEYGTMADADLETHNLDQRGYNSYERVQERYAWDTSRASSRGHHKSQSPDFVENSDLRHRLSKRGRMNGLRSVVSPDYNLNHHTEEGYQTTQRDTRSSPTRERSLSGRLQGRIKLPGRSPPIESGIVRSEGENERGWNLGRLGNRLRGRIQDDRDEGRNGRGLRMKKDTVHDNGFDFAAPKSLAELKGAKQTDNKQAMTDQQFDSLGKLKSAVSGPGSQQTEGDLSFEGPKPLSEILKRKRKAKSVALTSDNKEEIIKDSKKVTADEKGQDSNKKMKVTADEGKSSQAEDTKEPEIEEGLIASEEEDRDLEEYDKGDGEYEYEHDDGELDNFNNGEDAEHEEVFMDEDDGDDFAKKMGVSFS